MYIGFTQAANLRNHERIHTNDRPYVCVDCGKTFTQVQSKIPYSKMFNLKISISSFPPSRLPTSTIIGVCIRANVLSFASNRNVVAPLPRSLISTITWKPTTKSSNIVVINVRRNSLKSPRSISICKRMRASPAIIVHAVRRRRSSNNHNCIRTWKRMACNIRSSVRNVMRSFCNRPI